METNKISDFTEFQCDASALDKIRGGKLVEERMFSGDGKKGDGGCCNEYLIIYTDGSFSHEFEDIPCDLCEHC